MSAALPPTLWYGGAWGGKSSSNGWLRDVVAMSSAIMALRLDVRGMCWRGADMGGDKGGEDERSLGGSGGGIWSVNGEPSRAVVRLLLLLLPPLAGAAAVSTETAATAWLEPWLAPPLVSGTMVVATDPTDALSALPPLSSL